MMRLRDLRQKAAEAEPRPRQAKRCLEDASRQGSCFEDYITECCYAICRSIVYVCV